MEQYADRLVDLTDPAANRIYNLSLDEACQRLLPGDEQSIEGSFALVAKSGRTVRMARSLDRPLRYFLAKHQEGPALADRIDATPQEIQDPEALRARLTVPDRRGRRPESFSQVRLWV